VSTEPTFVGHGDVTRASTGGFLASWRNVVKAILRVVKPNLKWVVSLALVVSVPFLGTTFVGCGPAYTSEETEREIIEREDAENPEPEPESMVEE
jgi:hypothetical protein